MKTMTLSRDDFVRVLFSENFFVANPAFAHLQAQVLECKNAYEVSSKKSTCGCGGRPSLLFPCLDAVLDFAESVRQTQPEILQGVANYVAQMRNRNDTQSFVLYYRKTGTEPLRKVWFP